MDVVSRYNVRQDWETESSYSLAVEGELVEVITEVSSLVDTRTNTIYPRGAYRVRVTNPGHVLADKPRPKTFKGETAWSQAEQYAIATYYKLQRSTR